MVASGRAKRAKKYVFNQQGKKEKLSPALQKYINKKINRLMKNIFSEKSNNIYEAREFRCQMTGKKVYLPIDAQPVYNEDDCKWYLGNEVIVSKEYKNRHKKVKKISSAIVNGTAATDVPVVLGE